MDILVVIIIVCSVISSLSKAAKVKKNAPGRTAAPKQPPTPSGQSAGTADSAAPDTMGEFWRQVGSVLMDDEASSERLDEGHAAVTSMPEGDSRECKHGSIGGSMAYETHQGTLPDVAEGYGDGHEAVAFMPEGNSRECEHGSIGGSMAYESHQGGRTAPEEEKRLGRFVETQAIDSLYMPTMNAREMRRAVVMAEILKRPAERRLEQARRWSVR